MTQFMEKPCQHCPFRLDVKPFLHPDRAYEIAAGANNQFNRFTCHKTLEYSESLDQNISTTSSKECAGFLTLRATLMDEGVPKSFVPSFSECYEDEYHMLDAAREEWERQRAPQSKSDS